MSRTNLSQFSEKGSGILVGCRGSDRDHLALRGTALHSHFPGYQAYTGAPIAANGALASASLVSSTMIASTLKQLSVGRSAFCHQASFPAL